MIDSVNLYAANLYGATQNRQVKPSAPEELAQISETKQFQDLVEVKFNDYAKLSPTQILDKISAARRSSASPSADVTLDISSGLRSELTNLRKTLVRQETEARKASIGKANLVELMTATTKAENYLATIVNLRDEMKSAWEKIWGMNL